jgi:UDP-N-acetylmuramate dehydrogenase
VKKNHLFNTSYGAINDTLQRDGVTEYSIRSISETVIKIRKEKLPDPAVIGNAGSFFKNPVISTSTFQSMKSEYPTIPGYKIDNQHFKIPAAWLIEQCGWKGKRINGAGVHDRQALVIVNHGTASGNEIWKLATTIQSSVDEKFGVKLQPEVNVIS